MNDTKDVTHKCGKVTPPELYNCVWSDMIQCGVSLAIWHRSGHTEVLLNN